MFSLFCFVFVVFFIWGGGERDLIEIKARDFLPINKNFRFLISYRTGWAISYYNFFCNCIQYLTMKAPKVVLEDDFHLLQQHVFVM